MNYLENKNTLITGASSGIGARIIQGIKESQYINIDISSGYNLMENDTIEYIINTINDKSVDTVFFNAGIGDFDKIGNVNDDKIDSVFSVNVLSNMKIINGIWEEIKNDSVKVIITLSTASYINGAYESIYNASKKAMKEFIISANTELIDQGSENKIFMFIPHFVAGTKMTGGEMDTSEVDLMIQGLFKALSNGEDSFIPKYDDVYKKVFDNYKEDPYGQGKNSIEYKRNKGKI